MPKNIRIELRSEEVQEILTRVPNWMIRWGTVAVSGVIVLLLLSTWFIKYPDIVATSIVITTQIPPEKVLAKTSGKIEAILVLDKTIVKENTTLAIIQNSADYKEVLSLSKAISFPISEEGGRKSINFEDIINRYKASNLGEIQAAFSLFEKDCLAHDLNQELRPYQVQATAQGSEDIQIRARLQLLQQQKSLNESELQLQKNDINRYETLFNKGIISAQDFDNKKLSYLQAEKNYRSLLNSISQLQSTFIDNTRNAKSNQINSTKENATLESTQIQSFYNLKKAIKDWELLYVLKSSIAGKVSFLQIWTANQSISMGEAVFAVIPNLQKGYVGKLKAPALKSGKIKIGQQVNIRLANFPDNEYGMLQGVVQNISLTPNQEGNLLIDVVLPKKLETSYHKTIPFQQEMSGSAEIITEDLRLTERLLYQFRDIFRTN
ncbi:HlyD family secretion protein [Flavobacterium aquicola]|uniref:HlyD family secretion protein n=1 Tax=Flavobacterium aquicola TaxID=1682742 RepID=A0A3E0ERT8_9FLAO|nr:HlyD family efflux transporter periplasmic adaptor subunit [Flavobacterium aquicola]REH00100.1 HlyD family secretion protein [Flavobacterium aquicola]